MQRHIGSSEGLHEAGHFSSSINDPGSALLLKAADELEKFAGNGRVFEFGKKRAVEIG